MRRALIAALALAVPGVACAASADPAPQDFAIHGQATLVVQGVGGFASPYSGAQSLLPGQVKETFDATLTLGARLWHGAEIWADPEVDQGFGLSDTLGVAGFPSAEAYKVGKSAPYVRLQRLFLRQTIDLGGGADPAAAAANQLAGPRTSNRLILTLGKFAVGDVFDTNAYAHDPRADFLNWALVDTGTFDYAADAWGYTYGAAAELVVADWRLRLGAFDLSREPNGTSLETGFAQFELDGEIEHRHALGGHPGAVRIGVWRNHGRFARLAEAIAATVPGSPPPDLAGLRRPATRWGGTLVAEQEITPDLGLFLRAGLSDGSFETYDFTDIDRTLAVGGQWRGAAWGRKADRIGFAVLANGISDPRKRYLARGGTGVLIGDGALPHPGTEEIGEAWYDLAPGSGVDLTFDFQHVAHPGYNRDRGPAEIFALRVHGAF